MGNNSTKESPSNRRDGGTSSSHGDRSHQHPYNSRSGRGSRADLSSLLGIGSSSNDVPERRETKQEREARKLEKERVARIKERERSIKEEHVDRGFLVTMGVYTGHEDFNKPIVRQLMIERRIAPFWRGLDDFKDEWTEYQLIAAGRGLPIPAADEIPPEGFAGVASAEPASDSSNIQNLMVPISGRSLSASSDVSGTFSPSIPSPTSPTATQSTSPFRPRSKTLASLTTSSKNTSSPELLPQEIQLPHDPFVNGQQIEVFLYKNASECPICFLYYPPYLNKTRCCDQSICSECFVQIKRPDPHPPEHEHNDPSNPAPAAPEPAAESEMLVSEPSTCPYCQQPEFGVTYDPPPFRRGLAYQNPHPGITSLSSAMSSSSSLNSTVPAAAVPVAQKRRTTSISANASTVITTDRIRPDWATKLSTARSHLARRSAAATALHTAAYLMGNNQDSRSFRSRFGRHRHESPGTSGAATPSPANVNDSGNSGNAPEQNSNSRREGGGSSRRRNRMDDLEEMMMAEAIRLSLVAEEERKRKTEKEAAKEAKRKLKEDKKREKKERKVYGSGASSASGSALSLTLPGLGRRRGNSGASNLQREITQEVTEPSDTKGKGVDRGSENSTSSTIPTETSRGESSSSSGIPRPLDLSSLAQTTEPHPASPSAPDKPSHLRQMSSASSPASSLVESAGGSTRHNPHGLNRSSSTLDSPRASGTNIASDETPPEGEEGNEGGASESMFNFRSLAEMIGSEDRNGEDKQDAAKHIEYLDGGIDGGERSDVKNPAEKESEPQESVATLKLNSPDSAEENRQTTLLEPQRTTPEVMLTPETPAAMNGDDEEDKQLGSGWTENVTREITQ
ncbi:hypothetical protein HYALB_00001769 [Hymenoscyphus albidus]|uniref:Protein sip5 n=1 Tax=Hymenoscyphus albidus TaxID=595503 RepID=A0A9N9LR62_9HELO|nr:hypothetical protein HYALB_00001769 [Hymenoscyphus albidus]